MTGWGGERVAPRVLLTALVLLGCMVFGARWSLLRWTPPEEEPDARLQMMIAAVPTIEPEPDRRLVLVFGSSMVQGAFAPSELDAATEKAGVPTTSFNLAEVDTSPELLRAWAGNVANELRRKKIKAGAVYIELAPHMATKTAFRESWEHNELRMGPLVRPSDELRTALRHPELAAREEGLRLLGWRKPGAMTPIAKDKLFEPEAGGGRSPQWLAVMNSPNGKKWKRLIGGPAWNAEKRGETFRVTEDWAIEVSKKLTAIRRVKLELAELNRYDWMNLELTQHAIDDLIGTVREMQDVAEQVHIFVIPRAPQYKASALGHARLEAALRQFEAAGIPVANLFDAPGFEDDDFRDCVHLNHFTGRTKFMQKIGEYHLSKAGPAKTPKTP